MKPAILLSVQPQWCGEIVELRKTLEVRKNRPKLETPFKVYIYCTLNHSVHDLLHIHVDGKFHKANGKVIGEFICDQIEDARDVGGEDFFSKSRLTTDDWTKYTAGHAKPIYLWHISNLVVYDKPRELGEFHFPPERFCEPGLCGNCPKYESPGESGDVMWDCEWKRPILRPPQSWCYVEEASNGWA